jgi:hypothetical protein
MKEEKAVVKVSSLRQHPHYIRRSRKDSYIMELTQLLLDWKGEWNFKGSPVALQPIPIDHADRKDGAEYWMLDGHNRVAAAIEAKVSKIPANVISGMSESDAIAYQVRVNNEHGLRLSVADQTAAIKKMAEMNIKGKEIAEKMGISASSVSRIVGDKQRSPENPEAKRGGTGEQKKKAAKKFDAENWMKGLSRILKGWQKYGPKIRKAGFPDSCGKAMDSLSNELLEKE